MFQNAVISLSLRPPSVFKRTVPRIAVAIDAILLRIEGIWAELRLHQQASHVRDDAPDQALTDKYSEVKQQVVRLQSNDPDAWETLVNDWSPRLFGYLRRHVPTKEDAQDLLSETFAAAVKSIGNFDGNVAFSTWLYALAHNKIVDFWRRTKIESELPATLTVADDEISLDFKEAFKRLPDLARTVLQLRYIEGFGVDEVATVMGRSYKATESLLSRSRAMLKHVLAQSGMDTTVIG